MITKTLETGVEPRLERNCPLNSETEHSQRNKFAKKKKAKRLFLSSAFLSVFSLRLNCKVKEQRRILSLFFQVLFQKLKKVSTLKKG